MTDLELKQKQLRLNGRKKYVLDKLPPIGHSLGGAEFNEAGELLIYPRMRSCDYKVLYSARKDRLVYKTDDKGRRVVVDLSEIPLIEEGSFHDVEANPLRSVKLRDDLVEPAGTKVNIKVYRNDVVFESEPLRPKSAPSDAPLNHGELPIWEWEGDGDESYYAAKSSGVDMHALNATLRAQRHLRESSSFEVGSRSGVRAAITDFTKKSRNKLKFTLRNALCDWTTMVTLTYPSNWPRDGKKCKSQLNRFLTHLRSDYKGVKYVWFMEFQERGAPHFHIFLTCPLPGKTYVSPLWYHIVNSGDRRHLSAGTQVMPLQNSSTAISYATAYANKATQKIAPDEFKHVGRFWGSSRGLTSDIVTLEDVSIRQIQHIRGTYLRSFSLSGGRLDTMNCYFWGGSEWASNICSDYYNMHLRPFEAEMLDIGYVNPARRYTGAPWLRDSDPVRSRGHSKVLDPFPGAQGPCFPPSTDLDPLRYIEKRKDLTDLNRSRLWRNLTESDFTARLSPEVHAPLSTSPHPDRNLPFQNGDLERFPERFRHFPLHSLASAYGANTPAHTSKAAFDASAISLEEWRAFLGHLSERMKINWHSAHNPLYSTDSHVHIHLNPSGVIVKRRYTATRG